MSLSLVMQAKLLGFQFWMEDGSLETLQSEDCAMSFLRRRHHGNWESAAVVAASFENTDKVPGFWEGAWCNPALFLRGDRDANIVNDFFCGTGQTFW